MSDPKRIQLLRTKGWRKPAGVIVVSRPSKWGNPYRVGETYVRRRPYGTHDRFTVHDATEAVRLYRRWLFTQEHSYNLIPELKGHDLACWCPLDKPCHADVLLELANP